MGRWIESNVGRIDIVVLSPAMRVAQTWELLGAELDHGQVKTDPRVYQAWGSHLLDVVRELPDEAVTALVVGHEPGVSELSLTLANSRNHMLRRRVSHKYPTCAVALLQATRSWYQFAPSCAELSQFVAPRDF
jgi:phosphohistidine phosphatase